MRWMNRHGRQRLAFRATGVAATITFALSVVPVRAADSPPPSNLDLLTILTTEIAEELYGKFGPQAPQRAIELRPFSAGEDYVFVQNVFANVLTRHGVTTIAQAPAVRPAPSPATSGGAGGSTPAALAGPAAAIPTAPPAPVWQTRAAPGRRP